MKRIFLGVIRENTSCDEDGWVEGDRYLDVTESRLVYLVRFGMMNREVMALPEDVVVFPGKGPRLQMKQGPERTSEYLKYLDGLRADSKCWPRDSHGRFA